MKKTEKGEKCGPGNAHGRCCHGHSPFVAIPACLAGIYMLIVLLVLLFDSTSASMILVPVVWAFVVLGFFALLYAYQTHKILVKK